MNLIERGTEIKRRVKETFKYDTDPEQSGILFRKHADGVFFAFFTVVLAIAILVTVAAIAFLILRHSN